MNVLITGIGGFVGPYLQRIFEENGHSVFGLDRSGNAASKTHFSVDILNKEQLQKTILQIKPDCVVHLAGFSSVTKSFNEPALCMNINVIGTQNLIESCLALSNLPTVLIVGSSQIYGTPRFLPITEEHPLAPDSPYAKSRFEQEKIIATFKDKIPLIVTRSFNHTGPAQSKEFVLSDFAHQIVEIEKGIRPAKMSVGSTAVRRDFTDVRDVVRAYYDLVLKGKPGNTYNVCRGRSYAIDDLLSTMLKLSNISPEIISETTRLRAIDMPDIYGSNDKIRSHTQWQPQIPIEQTLKDLLAWWRESTSFQ